MTAILGADAEATVDDESGLRRLQDLVRDDMARVNQHILERVHSPVALIHELAQHLIAAGGKRLRPMLTLAAARLCGYDGDRHVNLAACVEFIHTATLLHDDVVDASRRRRGRATANAVWGNQAPILVGDFLFARAFQLMVSDGSLRVLKILSDAAAVIAEGEVLQLASANDPETPEARYFQVITAKTAALFAAATQVGAVVAARPPREEQALADYGLDLGIAFQMVDDVLDYSAARAALGKNVGDDFREGKATLPVLLAFQRGDARERAFWSRALTAGAASDAAFAEAQALMRRHGVLEAVMTQAQARATRAVAALAAFPDTPARAALSDLAQFCVHRRF